MGNEARQRLEQVIAALQKEWGREVVRQGGKRTGAASRIPTGFPALTYQL